MEIMIMAFIKHPDGPVFGDESTGTVFDGYVWFPERNLF